MVVCIELGCMMFDFVVVLLPKYCQLSVHASSRGELSVEVGCCSYYCCGEHKFWVVFCFLFLFVQYYLCLFLVGACFCDTPSFSLRSSSLVLLFFVRHAFICFVSCVVVLDTLSGLLVGCSCVRYLAHGIKTRRKEKDRLFDK